MRASRGLTCRFSRWIQDVRPSPGARRRGAVGLGRGSAGWLARGSAGLMLASGLGACTLITDVDREKIPQPVPPTFPEIDAGPQPTLPAPDASVPDASIPPDAPVDAGADGGGLDAGSDAGDAAAPADGDAG